MEILLDQAAVTAFQARLRGALLSPDDPSYEQARQVWNGMINKYPALIARCTGVADVVEAVQFANTHDLPVASRCGSHNAAGHATCDGGLVLDLTPMKGMRVDPARHRAYAQGGLLWGEFDRETQVYGLGTTGGAVNDTGIAGLTLGRGIGWLMGQYGLSCDNLVSADVVTADGEVITASATDPLGASACVTGESIQRPSRDAVCGRMGLMHLPITIREYCDDDWPMVCTAHDRARPDELRGSCDPRAFVPLATDQDNTASFQRSRKFVACIGEQVVGFVGIDGTYLSWLYVDPAYYRQGIGRRLLHLGPQLIGSQAWTIVLAGNTQARRLYESEGFRVVRIYESTNAGYPCICVQLALSSPSA